MMSIRINCTIEVPDVFLNIVLDKGALESKRLRTNALQCSLCRQLTVFWNVAKLTPVLMCFNNTLCTDVPCFFQSSFHQ